MKKNAKGFTMAEVLIVAAIIAVLVAISIPIFTKQLERSREETDISNLRSAYAITATDVLTGSYKKKPYVEDKAKQMWYAYYNPKAGKLVGYSDALFSYGKGTSEHGGADTTGLPFDYTESMDVQNHVVRVSIKTVDAGLGEGPELTVGAEFVKLEASGGDGSAAGGGDGSMPASGGDGSMPASGVG